VSAKKVEEAKTTLVSKEATKARLADVKRKNLIEEMEEEQSDELKPVTAKNLAKKVKCLCVNGTCEEGHSECDECFKGFEGKLCDIRSQSYNTKGRAYHIEEQDELNEEAFSEENEDSVDNRYVEKHAIKI